MSKGKFKVAVIGVGNMGKNHVRTYAEISEVEIVGVADTNAEIGKEISAMYKVPQYSDYREMVERTQPNFVSVCVPTTLHHDVAKYCLEHNVNVLLEKPIAYTLEEGKELLFLAKKNNLHLMVGHIERFNPAVRRVKEMLDRGELGQLTAIMARRVGGFPPQIKDANIAVDLAIHDIDIVNYILGRLPANVAVHKKRNHAERREDSVEFFLQYDGTSAYIQANWITPVKIRKLNITGSEGYLEMDYVNQQIEFYKSRYEKLRIETSDYSDFILRFSEPDRVVIAVAKKEPLREEILCFLNDLREGKRSDSTFALDALRIALTPSKT